MIGCLQARDLIIPHHGVFFFFLWHKTNPLTTAPVKELKEISPTAVCERLGRSEVRKQMEVGSDKLFLLRRWQLEYVNNPEISVFKTLFIISSSHAVRRASRSPTWSAQEASVNVTTMVHWFSSFNCLLVQSPLAYLCDDSMSSQCDLQVECLGELPPHTHPQPPNTCTQNPVQGTDGDLTCTS